MRKSSQLEASWQSQFFLAATVISLAVLARLLPHPPNATPIAAMALFGGAQFARMGGNAALRAASLIAPFAALFLSDLALGFHALMPFVYLAFAATLLLGMTLNLKSSSARIVGTAVGGSLLFFVVTNFAVWRGGAYAMNLTGLGQCFAAGLPFLRNEILGDTIYSSVFFAAWKLMQLRIVAPARVMKNGR